MAHEIQYAHQVAFVNRIWRLGAYRGFRAKRHAQARVRNHRQIVGAVAHGDRLFQRYAGLMRPGVQGSQFHVLGNDRAVQRSRKRTVRDTQTVRDPMVEPRTLGKTVDNTVETARYDAHMPAVAVQHVDKLQCAAREMQPLVHVVEHGYGQPLQQGDALAQRLLKIEFAIHGARRDRTDTGAQTRGFTQFVNDFLVDQRGVHIHDQKPGPAERDSGRRVKALQKFTVHVSIFRTDWDNNDMHISLILAQAQTGAPLQCATGNDGLIGLMTQWLITLMETVGGVGVALAIALESIFPPIPSEIILPLAGFTAAHGNMSLVAAIFWASMGSMLGAWALYGIARWFGLHRIHSAVDKIPGVARKDVDKANAWFSKYGRWSVLIGRIIPVVRSLISIPAGFNRMNFAEFSLFTFLGSAVWNSILVSAGYMLGDQWCSILGVLNVFEDVIIVVFAVILVVVAVRWIMRLVRTHKIKQQDEAA